MWKSYFLAGLFVTGWTSWVHAEDTDESRFPAAVEARDEEVAQRAKHRQYQGGADESELRVQNPLPNPVRKVTPTLEEKNESAGED